MKPPRGNLRSDGGISYSPPMPYVFPNEELFVGGVAFVIVGLLIVRAVAVKKQRARRRAEREFTPPEEKE